MPGRMFFNSINLIVAITLVILTTLSTQAKEKKITKKDLPKAVLSAFEKEYPNAKIKGLSKEEENKKTYFEIESLDGKTKRDLLYTAEGKVYEIEETISSDDLPSGIKSTLQADYPKAKILRAEKLTQNLTIGYELQIQTGKKSQELSFDAAGKLQSKANGKKSEKKEESEEEDED